MKTIKMVLVLVFLLTLGFSSAAMAQGVGPEAPETIDTFTISPLAAPIGTDVLFSGQYTLSNAGVNQTAFCFYFQTADAATWNAAFSGLDSDATLSFAKHASGSYCPVASGFGNFGFYATDTGAAVFGDTFHRTVTVPNVATGSKIIAVRQYEGLDCDDDGSDGGGDAPGGASCTLVNFRSVTNFVVQPAPSVVYAGLAGCDGNSPCYTSLAGAYNAVSAGGTIRLVASMPAENLTIAKDLTLLDYDGSGGMTGAAGSEVLHVTAGSVVVQDVTISAGAAANIVDVDGGLVVVKGNTLTGGALTFSVGGGVLNAYANNITGFTSGVALSGGTFNGRHNWWGSAATDVSVANSDAWDYRLGADVFAWGDGSLGGATVVADTASGTGVVVSHGRGDANAPFGKATTADGNTQCSDYYDIFTAPGATAGNWFVEIPIDAGTGCDATYNARQVFAYDLTAGGAPDPTCVDAGCWEDLKDNVGETLVQVGRNVGVRWSTASTAELGGTPVVAGNQDGNDPTAIVLESIEANSTSFWMPLAALALLVALSVGALYMVRRKFNV